MNSGCSTINDLQNKPAAFTICSRLLVVLQHFVFQVDIIESFSETTDAIKKLISQELPALNLRDEIKLKVEGNMTIC